VKGFERLIQFLQQRLSPESYAGLHLTIAVLIILVAGWWFGAIAEDLLSNGPLALTDQRVALWFRQQATPAITHAARAVTFFGSVAWLTVVSAGFAVVFVRRLAWLNLFVLASTMIGGSTLNVLLKHLFHRHRPVLENPLLTLSSYSFPSGHTMGATILYGLLALFATKTLRTGWARAACFIAACLSILLIGLSRIYLGAHFLSDVLGAFAASVIWLTICWTGGEVLHHRTHYPGKS
jgi:membrane-associated phospholipid phosphatase